MWGSPRDEFDRFLVGLRTGSILRTVRLSTNCLRAELITECAWIALRFNRQKSHVPVRFPMRICVVCRDDHFSFSVARIAQFSLAHPESVAFRQVRPHELGHLSEPSRRQNNALLIRTTGNMDKGEKKETLNI